jgi:hypothetical protein
MPSERSESRDLCVLFLKESAENTEDCPTGRAPRTGSPFMSIHEFECVDGPAERSLSLAKWFSVISAIPVRNPAGVLVTFAATDALFALWSMFERQYDIESIGHS